MVAKTQRRSFVGEDRHLAVRVGARLRKARLEAGLTQAQLAAGRYTKAYVSALENGLAKPSMAALNFLAGRLQLPPEQFLADNEPAWTRLQADLRLASGDWLAALDAYETLLAADQPDRVRAELLVGVAEAAARLGRGIDAVRAGAEAAQMFEAQSRPADAARAMYWQSSGLHELEQTDQAVALLKQILDRVAIGLAVEPDLPVRVLIALSANANRNDEPERALAYLEQARARLGDLDERKRAVFLFALASGYRELGDYEAAITTGTQSLAWFRAAEAEREAASLENELALVYLALGSLDQARQHASTARTYFEMQDDPRWLAHIVDTQSQIAHASGAIADATALATEAHRLATESGNAKAAISSALSLARAQRAAGDIGAAAATLVGATAEARDLGRRGQLQAVLSEWSDLEAGRGDMARAYELSRQALDAGRREPTSR